VSVRRCTFVVKEPHTERSVVGRCIHFPRKNFIEICKGSINHNSMLVNVAYLVGTNIFYLKLALCN
jgi:hypothetical protein